MGCGASKPPPASEPFLPVDPIAEKKQNGVAVVHEEEAPDKAKVPEVPPDERARAELMAEHCDALATAAAAQEKVSAAADAAPEEEKERVGFAWTLRGLRQLEPLLANIDLIDAHYLIALAEAGGVVPRWQDVPDAARINADTVWRLRCGYRLPILVLSYPRLDRHHPDKNGATLRRILPILRACHEEAQQAYGDAHATFGIFWDYMSLPQPVFRLPQAEAEKRQLKKQLGVEAEERARRDEKEKERQAEEDADPAREHVASVRAHIADATKEEKRSPKGRRQGGKAPKGGASPAASSGPVRINIVPRPAPPTEAELEERAKRKAEEDARRRRVDFELCGRPRGFDSCPEYTRFKQGLATMSGFYLHPYTVVLCARTPIPEGDYENARPYEERGWCHFELRAASMIKAIQCLWDLSCHEEGADINFNECQQHLKMTATRPPLMSPYQLGKELREAVASGAIGFSAGADADVIDRGPSLEVVGALEVVIELYEQAFARAFDQYQQMYDSDGDISYQSMGWGTAQMPTLLAAFRHLEVRCRPKQINEEGVEEDAKLRLRFNDNKFSAKEKKQLQAAIPKSSTKFELLGLY